MTDIGYIIQLKGHCCCPASAVQSIIMHKQNLGFAEGDSSKPKNVERSNCAFFSSHLHLITDLSERDFSSDTVCSIESFLHRNSTWKILARTGWNCIISLNNFLAKNVSPTRGSASTAVAKRSAKWVFGRCQLASNAAKKRSVLYVFINLRLTESVSLPYELRFSEQYTSSSSSSWN